MDYVLLLVFWGICMSDTCLNIICVTDNMCTCKCILFKLQDP